MLESGHREWAHPGDQEHCHDPIWNELINRNLCHRITVREPLPVNNAPTRSRARCRREYTDQEQGQWGPMRGAGILALRDDSNVK